MACRYISSYSASAFLHYNGMFFNSGNWNLIYNRDHFRKLNGTNCWVNEPMVGCCYQAPKIAFNITTFPGDLCLQLVISIAASGFHGHLCQQ